MSLFVAPENIRVIHSQQKLMLLSPFIDIRPTKLGTVSFTLDREKHQAFILRCGKLRDCDTDLVFHSVYGWLQHIKTQHQHQMTDAWLKSVLDELNQPKEVKP